MSAHDIEYKLPLIDTHKTNLLKYCPDFLAPLQCTPGKYRRFDGLCNNLANPTWGARLTTFTRLVFFVLPKVFCAPVSLGIFASHRIASRFTSSLRLLPPAYADGVSDPRIGHDGLPLPGARSITSVVHVEEGFSDHAATTLVVSWGQFMDHDFTLTGTQLSKLQYYKVINRIN